MSLANHPAPRNVNGLLVAAPADARISRALALIHDHIAVLTAQLITLPVLGLEVALGTPARASICSKAPAGLAELWHQARELMDALNGALPMDSPEFEAGMERLVALQDLIAATPATTAQEWAAKILNADDGGAIQSNGRWADALLSEARELMEVQA